MVEFLGILFLLAILCLPMIWSKLRYSSDTAEVISRKRLRQDAKIIDISRERVGLKGSYKIQTCITFDDGYKYYAYDTEQGLFTISVSEDTTKAIIDRAIQAHTNECGAEITKEFNASPTWICDACQTENSTNYGQCKKCGKFRSN